MTPRNDGQLATQLSEAEAPNPYLERRRQLGPPRRMTGRERRWLDPTNGVFKVFERWIDRLLSRFVYARLASHSDPYSRILNNRFSVAEISVSPAGWPKGVSRLRVLLLSDIHTGIFLDPTVLSEIVASLMEAQPDLVAIAGDIVTGRAGDVDRFLPALSPLSRAPLGAWYCHGNHDYFGGDDEELRVRLSSIGITTLRNDAVLLAHGTGSFVLGGIDDRILGKPDWRSLVSPHGPPHLLLAHHPDFFYEAAAHSVPLTLSGHTHGGQIRLPKGPPVLRQSRYCLDEGAYSYNSALLVVSRGLGIVGLPWRYGADPEAVLIDIESKRQ